MTSVGQTSISSPKEIGKPVMRSQGADTNEDAYKHCSQQSSALYRLACTIKAPHATTQSSIISMGALMHVARKNESVQCRLPCSACCVPWRKLEDRMRAVAPRAWPPERVPMRCRLVEISFSVHSVGGCACLAGSRCSTRGLPLRQGARAERRRVLGGDRWGRAGGSALGRGSVGGGSPGGRRRGGRRADIGAQGSDLQRVACLRLWRLSLLGAGSAHRTVASHIFMFFSHLIVFLRASCFVVCVAARGPRRGCKGKCMSIAAPQKV